ncbi:MAG: LysM peptidoglycan-binding domain-containing protein [Pyrinomonadaceae bacterium]|nr:LysM peptidoglycan-binding domain-containing protein [Pyrinomonadaceae bacterium]MCX7639202.1 LysM peptidoglycan-binding domain-containing protein [Pyrinomonadaceae bacterium]MDW8303576.1 LysM peptidoglycan-binding domain-containing protein [Acidobacteriota bacterium]
MSLTEKYKSLIDLANALGVQNLTVQEGEGVLHISGQASSSADKQRLWEEYGRIDPDFRSGDLVLNISAPESTATTYTVQPGDSLSKIGAKYGVSWQKIFEANKDKISDPDKIYPGQELVIPQE